jgi:hypothetical protein
MGYFQLKIRDDGGEVIEFKDKDANSALQTLFWRKSGRQAELWNAGKLLCKVERVGAGGDFWYVAPGRVG